MTAPTIDALHAAYRSNELTPTLLVQQLLDRCDKADPAIWIARLDKAQLQPYLDALEGHSPDTRPLYGIPFAIKDNIDLAGVPTTAACPGFSYVPEASAPVVQALIDAGAIPLGKANLDQFATGLVGTRSPYGVPANSIMPGDIPGGSSSGSAVAVALGLVTFSLGTDTAGSGRVPASFNNLVGFKPSRGVLSTQGVVPACKSLDCVSIFSLTAADAVRVFELTRCFVAEDAWARPYAPSAPGWSPGIPFRFGVLPPSQRHYFGAPEADALYEESAARLRALGGTAVVVDFEPFLETARLLYGGPWVAERYAATAAMLESDPDGMLPVTRGIISGGNKPTAVDAFRAIYRLAELKRASEALWKQVDIMLTPTAPRCYTIEEVEAEPVQLNTNLGTYTNFMNLLDLCGCAVPAGFLPNGRSWGVTLMAPAFQDERILALAGALHELSGVTLGATGAPLPGMSATGGKTTGWMPVVVCGAHMEGLPLNKDLLARGARLKQRTRTAPVYRMYHLPGAGARPPRPGLVRTPGHGASIDVEVWELPESALGTFFGTIKPPLGLGWVELEDGSSACGFVCENAETSPEQDITEHGGWRAWMAAQK
jgi:allophanate hydrolase